MKKKSSITVLHICNDFAGSKVHTNLVRSLDNLHKIEQVVYCPVRKAGLCGRNQFDSRNVSFNYSYVIKPWHRFVYHIKRRTLFKDMMANVNLEDVNIIHATTLFSDGALAYDAYKRYGIPYVVAVRSVDIESFAKMLPHTWPDGRNILLHASKVYFISNALMEKFYKLRFVKNIIPQIMGKFELRPNGVDQLWINNIYYKRADNHNVLFVGSLIPRKNVVRLIKAVEKVRTMPGLEDTVLTIVGEGSDKKTINAISHNSNFVVNTGFVKEKEKLMIILRQHSVFAVPSLHETFGLVYLEALSQNVPVLFTKKQGVDKMFDDENNPVGISVDAKSIDSIADALKLLLIENKKFSNKQVDFNRFNWDNIAKTYLDDYREIMS